MTLRDIRQIGICAALTSIVTVGAFSARSALSMSPIAEKPAVTVGGVTLTAVAKASEKPYTVEVILRAVNPLGQAKDVDVNLALVRSDFMGNPMSRTVQVNDYKLTTERGSELKLAVPAGKQIEKTIFLPVDSRPAVGPAKSFGGPPVYTLNVVKSGEALTEGNQMEPISLNSVRPSRNANTLATFSAEVTWPEKRDLVQFLKARVDDAPDTQSALGRTALLTLDSRH